MADYLTTEGPWDQRARHRGKLTDVMDAQRQDWDDEVARLGPIESACKAFDPGVRSRRRAGRRMCAAQVRLRTEREFAQKAHWRVTVRASETLPGIAGEVEPQLRLRLEIADKAGLVVEPKEYQAQGELLAQMMGGIELSNGCWRFRDGSTVRFWAE